MLFLQEISITRLQLDARVVVGQDVGKSVLGPVHRDVGRRARLVPTNVLQLLVLLRKPKYESRINDSIFISIKLVNCQ